MLIRKTILVFALLITGYSFLWSQTQKISELKKEIAGAKKNDARLSAVLLLCDETESLPADTLYAYATLAWQLADAAHSAEAKKRAAYYKAYSLYHKNQLDSVQQILTENSDQLKKEFPASPVNALYGLLQARLLLRKQSFKEALSIYYQVLNEAEKKNDTLNRIRAMAGVGNIFNRTGDQPGALSWFLKGISLGKGTIYQNKTAYIYTNAAVIYTRGEKYDSAKYYVTRGIQYARAAQNLGDLASALGMYSGLLMDINEKAKPQQSFTAAEQQLREALTIVMQIGDPNDIITNMGTLGNFYYDVNQPQKGIEICLQAIRMIRQYHMPGKLPFIYEMLAKNYQSLRKFKQQAETIQQLSDVKDSIYEQNSAESMSELKTKYEVQKKENTIIAQQLALVKKDYLIYSSILLFLLAACFVYVAFAGYKKRQKQKSLTAISSAEETERRRIAADLHDNLGAYAASIASNLNRLSSTNISGSDLSALQELHNNSNAMVSELSDTIWALKKQSLTLTSVSDRIKIFIQRIQNSYPGVQIDVKESISTDHPLSPSSGFHLFQTLQEAISNGLKHSRCSQIIIEVKGTEEGWEIQVKDNGTGMQAATTDAGGGNGLFNMKHRANEGGWQITWQGNDPAGTVVMIKQSMQ